MKFDIGTAMDAGQKRKGVNQDCIGIVKPGWFNHRPLMLVLADGMGGYRGGEIASQTVVDSFLRCYRSVNIRKDYPAVLSECLASAHRKVHQLGHRNKENASMGSTVVAAVLDELEISLINVGDSRAYHIHQDEIRQVSHDHSLVAEMVRKAELLPQDMLHHPKRNVLTMSISAVRSEVIPYSGQITIQPGDTLLLCSDGLWSVVPQDEILYYIQNFPPQEAAEDLVKQANENGGPDNISVIIARCCLESSHNPEPTNTNSKVTDREDQTLQDPDGQQQ